MKKILFYQIFKQLQQKPDLMRKLKWGLAIVAVFFFITTGLLIWAGIKAAQFVAGQTTAVISTALDQNQVQVQDQIKDQAQALKTKINELPQQFNLQGCMVKFEGLMGVQAWLQKPAMQNLIDLKNACLTAPTAALNSTQVEAQGGSQDGTAEESPSEVKSPQDWN